MRKPCEGSETFARLFTCQKRPIVVNYLMRPRSSGGQSSGLRSRVRAFESPRGYLPSAILFWLWDGIAAVGLAGGSRCPAAAQEIVGSNPTAHPENRLIARVGTMNIPGLITLGEAAQRFGVSHDELNGWIAAGVLEIINVDGERLIAEKQAKQVAARLARRNFAHLEGRPIRPAAAARKYKFYYMTLLSWVRKGYIRKLNDEAERAVFLNEADMAYARALADVKGRRKGQPLFSVAGREKQKEIYYLSLQEAARRYRVSPEKLAALVERGKGRRIQDTLLVPEEDAKRLAETQARREAVIRLVKAGYRHLENRPIRLSRAARKYDIPHTTLSLWAKQGHIRVLERGPNCVILDEADVIRAWLLKEVERLPRSEEVIVRLVRKSYPHLEGSPIRLDDAARK